MQEIAIKNKKGKSYELEKKSLEKKFNKFYDGTDKDEVANKKVKEIITRIINFLLRIKDDSERSSLITYIENFENFNQLEDFYKSLNNTVGQTRERLNSIFSKQYTHRINRLEHYTDIWEAEQLCKKLGESFNAEKDKKAKKALEKALREALKHYRYTSGKYRYRLLTTELQLKKIGKDIAETEKHISKQQKVLKVLKNTTDKVATEVAGRRARNNQLLRQVGPRQLY